MWKCFQGCHQLKAVLSLRIFITIAHGKKIQKVLNYYRKSSKGLMERNVVMIHFTDGFLWEDYCDSSQYKTHPCVDWLEWNFKTKRGLQWITKGLHILESLNPQSDNKADLWRSSVRWFQFKHKKVAQDFNIFMHTFLCLVFIKTHSFIKSVEP